MTPSVVVHCDWSKRPAKRWPARASRCGRGWHLERPQPVGSTCDFLDRMRCGAAPGGLLAGFDFPIGIPAAYGARTGLRDFREALGILGSEEPWRDWFHVCNNAAEISLHRPFYPMRPGGRRLADLLDGLALDRMSAHRWCERKTSIRPAACMLFWTLGGNQVGKAAAGGWREVLQPNLHRIGLWPFDGELPDLFRRHDIVIAETYPGEVYDHLGIPRRPVWSKKKQSGRASVAEYLVRRMRTRGHLMDDGLEDLVIAGFSARSEGEDQFDAMVGLLGMLDVADGHRPAGTPAQPDILRWEGWILGQRQESGDLDIP